MQSNTSNLISLVITQDSIGNSIKTETSTTIFVDEYSIGAKEFYSAAQSGFRPDILLKTFVGNYNNQTLVDYKGKRYTIYRTFIKGDVIEMYLTIYGKDR